MCNVRIQKTHPQLGKAQIEKGELFIELPVISSHAYIYQKPAFLTVDKKRLPIRHMSIVSKATYTLCIILEIIMFQCNVRIQNTQPQYVMFRCKKGRYRA